MSNLRHAGKTVQQLAKRWFVMRDLHAVPAPVLLHPPTR